MVFHIDTAFMFIIGGLLIVKIFQSRHSDVHSNAFVAFFCFAVVIFFTLIGIVRMDGWFVNRKEWTDTRWIINK